MELEPVTATEGDTAGPGRPRGMTLQGEDTRRRLYATAVAMIAEEGFEGTTLRAIATRAGVSVGLLYRYFPSKLAVVLAFHDELSQEYVDRFERAAPGSWRDRFLFALRTSLEVLGPHRDALVALVPALVSNGPGGVLAAARSATRLRVERAFVSAVADADDAPEPETAHALGRLLYLGHLAILLFWLLDKSDGQRATATLLDTLGRAKPLAAMALRFGAVRKLVVSMDAVTWQALLGEPENDSAATPIGGAS